MGTSELARAAASSSEACRRRIGAFLRGDSSGSARLAAADERINRALVDAVERHATKDPGTRGILTRATLSVIPSHDPNTGTGDVTREVRRGPTQDATRASSSDDTSEDVVMREDSADENSVGHPSASERHTAEGGSQRRGNHVSNQAPLNSTFREGSRGKRRF